MEKIEPQPHNPASTLIDASSDWCHVRETLSMLRLAMTQIECTLSDSAQPVNELSHSFVNVAGMVTEISNRCRQNNASSEENLQGILGLAEGVQQQMLGSTVAFQFYDKLSQKLAHVNLSLTHLSELINDNERRHNPEEWRQIQDEIRATYTMECERIMFDCIMQGSSIEEALELYRHQFEVTEPLLSPPGDDDEVELF